MPALPPPGPLARAALGTWRARMINEYTSHHVFDGLARQLGRAGRLEEAEACAAFSREEQRHGVLCGAVVEALGGEARFAELPGSTFPEHADVPVVEGIARNLISISCLSETVAVALIGAERLSMPEGPLRDLLTTIYADEVGHARFGWRLAAAIVRELDMSARSRLGDYLRVAFAHLEEHELAHLNPGVAPPPEGAALGLCNGQDARELFYATVAEVIVPSLVAMGCPPRGRWRAAAVNPAYRSGTPRNDAASDSKIARRGSSARNTSLK